MPTILLYQCRLCSEIVKKPPDQCPFHVEHVPHEWILEAINHAPTHIHTCKSGEIGVIEIIGGTEE